MHKLICSLYTDQLQYQKHLPNIVQYARTSCQSSSDASRHGLYITSECVLWSLAPRLQQQIFKVARWGLEPCISAPLIYTPILFWANFQIHISDGLGVGPVFGFSFLYFRHLSVTVMEKMCCAAGNNMRPCYHDCQDWRTQSPRQQQQQQQRACLQHSWKSSKRKDGWVKTRAAPDYRLVNQYLLI